MEVIGEALEGNEAIQKAHELNPDVLVVDGFEYATWEGWPFCHDPGIETNARMYRS